MLNYQRIFIGFSSFSFPMQRHDLFYFCIHSCIPSFVRSFVRDFLRTYIVGGFNYFIPNTCIQTALFDLPHPPLNQSEALRTSVGARPPACWRFVNETSLALTLFQREFPQKQTDAQHIRILPGWIIRGYRLSEEFL